MRFPRELILACVVALAACSDGNLIRPENLLEVSTETDLFEFRLTALDDVSDARAYDWQNTGSMATVDIDQAITSGQAVLRIRDAAGLVVYEADIAEGVNATTSFGVDGLWRVSIRLDAVKGGFSLTVRAVT